MFRLLDRFAFRREPSLRHRALAALKRGDFERAETDFTILIEQAGPGDQREGASRAERAFLLNKRGVARAHMRSRQLALADFAAALTWIASYAPALTNLGNLLLEDGDVEGAIARYQAAILADPQYPVAHLNLGVAYKRAGRIEEGVRALRDAARLEKTRFWIRRRPS